MRTKGGQGNWGLKTASIENVRVKTPVLPIKSTIKINVKRLGRNIVSEKSADAGSRSPAKPKAQSDTQSLNDTSPSKFRF